MLQIVYFFDPHFSHFLYFLRVLLKIAMTSLFFKNFNNKRMRIEEQKERNVIYICVFRVGRVKFDTNRLNTEETFLTRFNDYIRTNNKLYTFNLMFLNKAYGFSRIGIRIGKIVPSFKALVHNKLGGKLPEEHETLLNEILRKTEIQTVWFELKESTKVELTREIYERFRKVEEHWSQANWDEVIDELHAENDKRI